MAKPTTIEAGKLNRRIRMQSATETRDAHGGVIKAWADIGDAWVSIEPMTARELWQAQQVNSDATTKMRGRYDSRYTSKMRAVLHDGRKDTNRTLNLENVILDEVGESFQAMCKEVT